MLTQLAAIYWSASHALQAKRYSARRHRAFDDMQDLARDARGLIQALARLALLQFNARNMLDATLSDSTGTYRLSADGRRAEWIGPSDLPPGEIAI